MFINRVNVVRTAVRGKCFCFYNDSNFENWPNSSSLNLTRPEIDGRSIQSVQRLFRRKKIKNLAMNINEAFLTIWFFLGTPAQ